jgi:CRISPR system Cascade subunit CasB
VERFVGADRYANDPWRLALYLVAGLFALHPKHESEISLATAFGRLAQARDSTSIEQRFVALLSADPEHIPQMLRQTVSLLAADGHGFDFARLLDDMARWLNPNAFEARDNLRQRWARDFYRAYDGGPMSAYSEPASTEQAP